MGGTNPYIQEPDVKLPTTPYTITFLPMNVTVKVDPEKLPYSDEGLTGSILEIAVSQGIDIDHACGGVCACSTCHVIIKEGAETLNEPIDEEDDQLEEAPGLTPASRLACQAVPDGTRDLIVEVPQWNRNLVSEEH